MMRAIDAIGARVLPALHHAETDKRRPADRSRRWPRIECFRRIAGNRESLAQSVPVIVPAARQNRTFRAKISQLARSQK